MEYVNDSLPASDVRAIVRLLGEICALSGGHAEKKRCLMDGLCRIVDADAWVWDLATRMEPARLPVYTGMQHGGFSEAEFAHYLTLVVRPEQTQATATFAHELQTSNAHLTRTLQQVLPQPIDWDSPLGRDWKEYGFFSACVSYLPIEKGVFSGITLYRRYGSPLFDEREASIAHIVMSEVPWLHHTGWTADGHSEVNALTPRLWLVHESLLQGFSRKRIADNLGITVNTVNGYVNEIFRHFGVRSHTELMHCFYHGNVRNWKR